MMPASERAVKASGVNAGGHRGIVVQAGVPEAIMVKCHVIEIRQGADAVHRQIGFVSSSRIFFFLVEGAFGIKAD